MDLKRLLFALAIVVGCAAAPAPARVPDLVLTGSDGRAHALIDSHAELTVVEFFSRHCPCQAKHDERMRGLATSYAERNVRFLAVDSEAGASASRARDEAERRGYPFPILVDASGSVARRAGATYATYTLVADRTGRILYAGGIDSDKNHLTDDATWFLRDALDDALAGRAIRRPVGKTLGCALMLE
jgi:peroxiredoxin